MQTQTQAQVQENSGSFARAFEALRQTAQRAADAAVDAVRSQAIGVVDAYRGEVRRAIAAYTLCRAVLLFTWSAAGMVIVTVELVWWDSHRIAVSLAAAGGFLLLAGISALLVAHLTRRSR